MSFEAWMVLALMAGAAAGWLVGWRLRPLVALSIVCLAIVGVWVGWAWNAESPFENDEDGDLARVVAMIVGAFVWAGWSLGIVAGSLVRRRRDRFNRS